MVTTVLGPISAGAASRPGTCSDSAAGALFTAQFSGSLSAGALSGLLVSRIGDRRTLALGYATMCAGLLAIAAGARAAGVAGLSRQASVWAASFATNLLVARGRPDRAASALGVLNLFVGNRSRGVAPCRVGDRAPRGDARGARRTRPAVRCCVRAPFSRWYANPDAVRTNPRLAAAVPMARVALFECSIWLYSGTEMALGGVPAGAGPSTAVRGRRPRNELRSARRSGEG